MSSVAVRGFPPSCAAFPGASLPPLPCIIEVASEELLLLVDVSQLLQQLERGGEEPGEWHCWMWSAEHRGLCCCFWNLRDWSDFSQLHSEYSRCPLSCLSTIHWLLLGVCRGLFSAPGSEVLFVAAHRRLCDVPSAIKARSWHCPHRQLKEWFPVLFLLASRYVRVSGLNSLLTQLTGNFVAQVGARWTRLTRRVRLFFVPANLEPLTSRHFKVKTQRQLLLLAVLLTFLIIGCCWLTYI